MALSVASMLEDEFERESVLVLMACSAASTLDEEPLSARLDVWLVEMTLFTEASAASTLEEELEKFRELVLRVARVASKLDEELLKLRLEV